MPEQERPDCDDEGDSKDPQCRATVEEIKETYEKLWVRHPPIKQSDSDNDNYYDAYDYQDGRPHRFHLSSIFNEIEISALVCYCTMNWNDHFPFDCL